MVAVEIKISFLGRQISLVCVNVSASSAAYGSTDVSVIHLECFSVVFFVYVTDYYFDICYG